MKTYQFEEIIFWLSFIAYMVSRIANLEGWMQTALLVNACLNLISALFFAIKHVSEDNAKIYGEMLGLDEAKLAELKEKGVI